MSGPVVQCPEFDPGLILSWSLIMIYFLQSFFSFAVSRRAVVWANGIFANAFRRVPEAFYRVCTLQWVRVYSPLWGQQWWSPVAENGYRAFHCEGWNELLRHTQLNTISFSFLPKIKSNSLKPYTCSANLYAHAYLRTGRYTPDFWPRSDLIWCQVFRHSLSLRWYFWENFFWKINFEKKSAAD